MTLLLVSVDVKHPVLAVPPISNRKKFLFIRRIFDDLKKRIFDYFYPNLKVGRMDTGP